jgi:hypothetical protein
MEEVVQVASTKLILRSKEIKKFLARIFLRFLRPALKMHKASLEHIGLPELPLFREELLSPQKNRFLS